ncbi:hypothetical protein KAW18_05020 [candidate division WOR-3 bacterium]|nr:hypothetical protein [candidate division WOR-3 bacterium]MCK4526712.1 hypothetical protein [candidate division WOR-3 bacterium]
MRDKLLIFFSILSLLTIIGCSEEGGNPFNRILSKTVETFSPKTEKAEIINLLPAAEGEEETKDVVESETTYVDSIEDIEKALHWTKIYYTERGKPDPFRPLLTKTETEEKRVNVDLAKLVGIIWGKNGYLALLKEGNIGYVLKEGDRVIDGRVIRITKDSITFLLSRFGEQNRITMNLKKER